MTTINDDDPAAAMLSSAETAKTTTGNNDTRDYESAGSSFSLDLASRCVSHYEFLKKLYDSGIMTGGVTEESLRRYLLWLNMLAKLHDENDHDLTTLLQPPPDVAWLWHVHRLAPVHYQEFLQKTCMAAMVPGSLKSYNALLHWKDPAGDPYSLDADLHSKQTWESYYPNESFELDDGSIKMNNDDTGKKRKKQTLKGFDLLASAKNQAEFYWQIQPLFRHDGGVVVPTFDTSRAIRNYGQFLELIASKHHNADDFKLVPTYEIDFMWHTHMTGGSVYDYHSDCEVVGGKLIDHDDAYGDGDRSSEHSILNESFRRTAQLWKQVYQDDSYAQNGGYRGPPPAQYFEHDFVDNDKTAQEQPALIVAEGADEESNNNKPPLNDDGTAPAKHWSYKVQECCASDIAVQCACVMTCIGLVLVLCGAFIIKPVGYVCGDEAPTRDELQARGNGSLCLTLSISDDPLCLMAGLDPSEPSIWCTEGRGLSHDNFNLWWSPCTKCGTAWRIDSIIDDDKSRYKYPEPDQPGPDEMPPGGDGWLEWNPYRYEWESTTTVEIQECPAGTVNDDGIPEACFAHKTFVALWAWGAVLMLLPCCGCFLYYFLDAWRDGACGPNSGGSGRYAGGGVAGGGVGYVGGGWVGGGGGGCGGC